MTRRDHRMLWAALSMGCLSLLLGAVAFAQPPESELPPAFAGTASPRATRAGAEPPQTPWRWTSWVGAGASLRLLVQDRFQQSRLAPPFLELSSGLSWPYAWGGGRLWTGLNATLGLARDGTLASGVRPLEQFVLGPSVRWMHPLRLHGSDVLDGWWWLAASAPFALFPAPAPGLEVAAGLACSIRAGLGLYAEATLATFAGGAPAGERSGVSLHPLLGLEAGFLVDWEVLP